MYKITYTVGLSQGGAAGLGHPNMIKLSFLNKFPERLYRFLNWDTRVDPSTLEKIQFLRPSEVVVDTVNTAPQILFAAASPSFNGQEGFICVFWVLLVERSQQLQVG